jgi:hypothetical protein
MLLQNLLFLSPVSENPKFIKASIVVAGAVLPSYFSHRKS